MNSEEGVSLAKMAVTVLLVVLVIGAVVAIVYAAYSWFSSGTDKLSDQVVSIDKSSFSQYDDAQVSGTDVLSALKSYRESDIAIVVANLNNEGGSFDVAANTVNGYNYCALIGESGDTSPMAADATGHEVTLTNSDGLWYTSAKGNGAYGLAWSKDMVTLYRNTNFSPTTTNGNASQFVKQSASWYANLIYDSTTDDICGILFRQMN